MFDTSMYTLSFYLFLILDTAICIQDLHLAHYSEISTDGLWAPYKMPRIKVGQPRTRLPTCCTRFPESHVLLFM